ncbi:hypothetical protein [Clostridium sp. D53t1_180928_C8]|uniref:hypothetical protein n=1 Tax=Clostridium sp. D53t1_180928_C8 TaxID=2787101 RepID=UPI0018ABDA6F|nr:hypothetical protein [Clostridium sp. D53t1_180928_C8]
MRNSKRDKDNFTCKKIRELIYKKGLKNSNVVEIIDKNSSKDVKQICTITIERMNEITDNIAPTVMECILIGQALGKGIGYFYYNGYQIY